MKEWLTARELATETLPDLPTTERGLQLYAARHGWDGTSSARERAGRGGAIEYHISLLPTLAQVTYGQRHMVLETPEAKPADAAVSARAAKERDARLAIVHAFGRFGAGMRYATRVQVFVDRYNAGLLTVPDFVRETVPSLSKRTLIRWCSAKGKGETLGHDPAQSRKGKGILETANAGRVKAFILGLIAHQPHLCAEDVQMACRAEFGDMLKAVSKGVETFVPMPPVRTFQHTIKGLKVTHKVELTKLTNPDLYRSTMAPSGVGMLRHVTEANALWQIDASPWDALCVDGRHSIYASIDIATRRVSLTLSRTPRASAVALLMRKAIVAWGVPKAVQTDNGSDFTARDTERLFHSLGIEPLICDAYSPEQKGHVERVIKTFQHRVGPLLPGFIGHSVADRKAIESRRSFAARLGASDAETFAVSLTSHQLQRHLDDWIEAYYQHRPHAGLKGDTPFKAALACEAPIRRVDERALDLLLMPVAGDDGRRVVTKFGVRIDHYHYMTPTILPGQQVFVRQDPADLGRAYVFAEDGGTYLGEALCPELAGIDPKTWVAEAKALQREIIEERSKPIRREARRIAEGPALIERVLEVARRDSPNIIPLPKREVVHSTAQIAAAIEAMGERVNPTRDLTPAEAAEQRRIIEDMQAEEAARSQRSVQSIYEARLAEIEAARTAHLPDDGKVVALPESPRQRYRRAMDVRAQVEAGTAVPADAMWLGGYEQSAEYRSHRQMHEDFGDAWLMS